ncbi:MAG: phage major capsid protein [Armatimonadota bacterium]|nr:phage major capsid protein [Armatimonadota bacterium]
MLTKEELLAQVREEVEKSGARQGAEVIRAVEAWLAGRFPAPAAPVKTAGEIFAADEHVKAFIHNRAKTTPPVKVPVPGYGLKAGEYLPPRAKATITSGDFPSERTYLPLAEFPQRGFRLRDLIPVAGLGTPSIEYARVTGYTNSAGGVAEGAAKPESAITTQNVTDSVKTIATFIPVTRQALRDVQGLGAYINQVLGYFLQLEEDDEILNGTGGTEMTGILQTSGILSQAFATNIIETVRKGITLLQTAFTDAGFDPTGLVLNPNDWETAELIKDTTGRYLLLPDSRPQEGSGEPRLWRLPVVTTPAIAAGTGLLGAFDIGATLWTYEDLELAMTDSHADWFAKNLVAVRAEFRELLAVYFPKAFCQLAFS